MNILIGVILILGGIGYALYTYTHNSKKTLEMKYMQTTSIKDAIDIVEQMSFSDPGYRHYVELKGTVKSDEDLHSQYENVNCVYYQSACYSVIQEKQYSTNSNGSRSVRMVKKETKLGDETRSCNAYINDGSCDNKVLVNFESFNDHIDLKTACNRFEESNSLWARNHGGYYSSMMRFGPDARFLGYKLVEKFFPVNSPIYVLGELHKMGDNYVVESANSSGKPYMLSYKSEDEIIGDNKKKQMVAIGIGLFAVLIGIILIVA